MTCICFQLVSAAHANHFIKSHRTYICVFLLLYLKTMSLNSLKIMKKSPITEHSDIYPNLMKENRRMLTCNQLDLQTLGSQTIMHKISPINVEILHCILIKLEVPGKFLGILARNKGHFTHETESPQPLHFKHSHWWERQSRSKFASHYTCGTNKVCDNKMDVKSTWVPTWHQMEHGFMVTWIIFKNHLLEVGLTQNWETMALRTLTTVGIFYFTMCEDRSAWIEFHQNSIWLRAWSHMTSHYTRGSVTILHGVGGVLGRPLDTFLLGSHNFMVTAPNWAIFLSPCVSLWESPLGGCTLITLQLHWFSQLEHVIIWS